MECRCRRWRSAALSGAGDRTRTCTPLREGDFKPNQKGRRINVYLIRRPFPFPRSPRSALQSEDYGHPGGHLDHYFWNSSLICTRNSLSSPVPWSPLESSPVLERYWKAAGTVSRRLRPPLAEGTGSLLDRRSQTGHANPESEPPWLAVVLSWVHQP